MVFRAVSSQLNDKARTSPLSRSSLHFISSLHVDAERLCNLLRLTGVEHHPATPITSGRDVALEQITGQPQAMASTSGMPNPSNREGKTSIRADCKYKAALRQAGNQELSPSPPRRVCLFLPEDTMGLHSYAGKDKFLHRTDSGLS